MANITGLFGLRHLRAEPAYHVLQTRGGKPVRSGRGLAFWFHALSTSIAALGLIQSSAAVITMVSAIEAGASRSSARS